MTGSCVTALGATAFVLLTSMAPVAATPAVVVSIKPVHSLVAGVMQGIGTPQLIVKGAYSPHSYALKPSDAKALAGADVVFWVGEGLEKFLENPIKALTGRAAIVALSKAPGLRLREVREGGLWGGHSTSGQAHIDMHIWHDPDNAKALVREVVRTLVHLDPGAAATFMANGQRLVARLDRLAVALAKQLAAVKNKPFIVFHDAFQYFDTRFDLKAVGAVTAGHDVQPGAKRVREMRRKIIALGAVCVFAEPPLAPKLVAALTEGSKAKIGVLDPIGAGIAAGPELYFTLMERNAKALTDCLANMR